jgi:hypothetical protein
VDQENLEKSQKSLTCIHSPYTLSATPESKGNEIDELAVKEFLNTLAEIALSIASRNGEVNP